MLKTALISTTAAMVAVLSAAPATAATPPVPVGTYSETLTRADGKIQISPAVFVMWSCGEDCFQIGIYKYRFDAASGHWQTATIEDQDATCPDGTVSSGDLTWWTADGITFTGSWLLDKPCPGGPPVGPSAVLTPISNVVPITDPAGLDSDDVPLEPGLQPTDPAS